MPLFAKDGGVWKGAGMPVRDGGVWKNPTQVYARDGGVWKPVFSSAEVTFQLLGTNLSRSGSINTGEASDTKSIVIFYVYGQQF